MPQLPKDGNLLFFADLDEERLWMDGESPQDQTRVLYIPANQTTTEEHPLPDDMPDINHIPGQPYSDYGINQKHFPKWPIEAKQLMCYDVTETPGLPTSNRDYAKMVRENYYADMQALLPDQPEKAAVKFFSQDFVRDETSRKALKDEKGRHVRTYSFDPSGLGAGFPFTGFVISEFIENLREGLAQSGRKKNRDLMRDQFRDDDQKQQCRDQMRLYETFSQELGEFERSLGPLFDHTPPTQKQSQALINWITENYRDKGDQLGGYISKALGSALKGAVTSAVSDPKMFERISPELIANYAPQLCPTSDQSEHVLLGAAQFKTNSTASKGIRLLVLDSDSGMDFMFCDCGVTEFWISEEDFGQWDFHKAYAITAGG